MQITPSPIRDRAKQMRRQATRSEAKLWSWLRMRRFGGFKFRRQHPVGPYVLDFYCHELKLAIEADGSHHAQHLTEYDDARSAYLETYGIVICRIANKLLATESDTVATIIQWSIDRAVERRSAPENHAPHPTFDPAK